MKVLRTFKKNRKRKSFTFEEHYKGSNMREKQFLVWHKIWDLSIVDYLGQEADQTIRVLHNVSTILSG
jgi:hypothetical protein